MTQKEVEIMKLSEYKKWLEEQIEACSKEASELDEDEFDDDAPLLYAQRFAFGKALEQLDWVDE